MLQFETPWVFALLAVLVPFAWWCKAKSYADLGPGRAMWALALRILGLAAIVTAIAKPVLLLPNTDRALIYLVDVSDSVSTEALEGVWQALQEETAELERDQHAGLVLFGRRPVLARPLSNEPLTADETLTEQLFHRRELDTLRSRRRELERAEQDDAVREELTQLDEREARISAHEHTLGTDETDLEAACRLARGLLPVEARRRVVLFSDGNANRGDILRELTELDAANISVHTRALVRGDEPEVIAEQLRLPAEAQVKAPFRIEFGITSNVETNGTVRIYRNKFLVDTQDVQLVVGKNLLELPRVQLDEGFHEFEAIVAATDDTELENNIARGVVRVAGRPKVLLVERAEREARYLEEALAAEEIELEVRPIQGLPRELNDLLRYDVLMLSDVSAHEFAPGGMELVKTYVREMGGGLVMLGGEYSFGLGGYYRTPIEDTLPVKMPIKKNVEKPNLALALVIDKSGSMSGTKMELAKEAAIAAAEVLKGNDRFGAVAFDTRAEWITRMTEAHEVGTIVNSIARLVSGGGTNIYPALHEAYQALLDEDAKLKHIILLSDGQTGGSGYDTLVGHIAADGITVSSVGIGEGADRQLLGDIAAWGGGEAYFTNDFSTIPQIFTRETMRASKSMLVEEPFVPLPLTQSAVMKGIDPDDMPFLLGYVATQPKDLAEVALVSDYGDPVLASWNFGLGKSVAFTSDAKARWAGDWIGWEGFSKFWGQLVRSVMSTGSHHDLRSRTRVDIEDGIARITVDVRDRVGAFRDDVVPEISVLEQEAEPRILPTTHLAPGLFRAELPIEKYGEFYRLLVVQRQDGNPVDVRALGVTESYSPEFRTASPNSELLELMSEKTGGTVMASLSPAGEAETLWKFEGSPGRTPKETWWWWLLLAGILLPIDIATRRLGA